MADDDHGKKDKKKDDHPTPEGKVKVTRTQTIFEDAHPKKKSGWFPTFSGPSNWPQAAFGIVCVLAILVSLPMIHRWMKEDLPSASHTAQVQKDHKSFWDTFLVKPDQPLSPFNKNGEKSGKPISPYTNNRAATASTPFIGDGSAAITSAACAGKKHAVTLRPGVWQDVDQFNACRITAYKPGNVRMKARDEQGEEYDYPEAGREVTSVKTIDQTIRFSYSRCPKGTSGALNWDCTPLQQYAAQ